MNPLSEALAVPTREPQAPDLTDFFATPHGEQRLFDVQSRALHEITQTGGLFGQIGVGLGKTLITMLAPLAWARWAGHFPRTLFLMPAGLRNQFLSRRIEYQKNWTIPKVESLVLSYSNLSQPKHSSTVDAFRPELIVADEGHKLANLKGRRAARVKRYIHAYPETSVAILSGTMSKGSLGDYAHLLWWALKDNTPLPTQWTYMQSLIGALDPLHYNMRQDRAAAAQLCESFGSDEDTGTLKERARLAWRRRLEQTPGVVLSRPEQLGVSLEIARVRLRSPECVESAISHVDTLWETPGSETLYDMPAHVSSCKKQLRQGFYYARHDSPDPQWRKWHSIWQKALRRELRKNRPGIDSPALIRRAAEREDSRLMSETLAAWNGWKEHKDVSFSPAEPVWLSDYMLERLQELINGRNDTLVWYSHNAVKERLREIPDLRVCEPGEDPRDGNQQNCAVSIKSHGTGLHLVNWARNIVLCAPASAPVWEQLIGRTHRTGQTADRVLVILLSCPEYDGAFSKARARAKAIQQKHGQPQRICYASEVSL